jgi:hypothetical protein
MDYLEFANIIESICLEKDVGYIDAIILWCEEHEVEPEAVAIHIEQNQSLKSKIQTEAENMNVIKKVSRLPLDDM